MGQGNAIAHLMPPPFYAYRYVVAKARAPEESIQDMIDACGDATPSEDKRFKIEVMPGIYDEEIAMIPWVDVVAPYGRAVIRPGATTLTDSVVVTMASNCMLQGLMIDLQTIAGTGITGVEIEAANTNCYLEDCWITAGGATDTGIVDDSDGTTVIIRRCRLDGAATGYRKTGTGTTWFYDNRVTGSLAIRTVQGAVADDGGSTTDETSEANSAAADDMTLLPLAPVIDDAYYFGGVYPFQQLSLNVGIAGVGTWTILWEYYDRETADWATLTVTDNTTGFHVADTSTVTFTPPATWAVTTVESIDAYWIRARVTAATLPITIQPKGTQAWVTDAIDVDVDGGTLNMIECKLMFSGTGANVDVAAATVRVNSYDNTLAGDGWRIGDNANATVYSHNDNFTKVIRAGTGLGFMIAKEEPRTYLVHDGMQIGDALYDIDTNIGDASDTNRYSIRVFPGEYSESVTMVQYVDLLGESAQSCVISQAATQVIAAAANSRIKGVRVELTAGTGQAGIYINDVATILEGVTVIVTRVSGTNYGVQTAGSGGVTAYGVDLYANNDNDYPASFGGTGTHVIYDSYFENGAGAGAYDIGVTNSTVNSFNNKLMGAGWEIASDSDAIVRSHTDFFTAVSKGADGIMTCQEKPNIWRVFNGMEIADAHTSASAGDSIEVGPGSYTETLAISKGVTLISLDGAERTTITQVSAAILTITSDDAVIDGFTIAMSNATGAQTSVVLATYDPTIRNCIFTQAGDPGTDISVSTGTPEIDNCIFSGDVLIAISQTGNGGTSVFRCLINSGSTAGVQIADGSLTISHSTVNVGGNGLSTITLDGIIYADHCDVTGSTIDMNVAATAAIYADGCTYNDVANLGTFVDLTGCREYALENSADAAVNDWVYLDSTGPYVKKADATDIAKMPAIGVVVYKPTTTTAKIKNYGYLYCSTQPWTDDWGSWLGQEWWVSDDTAGFAEHGMPAVWPQRLGVPLADEGVSGRFKILIGDNLGLVHTNIYSFANLTPLQGAAAYDVDGAPYTDETAEANEATANDMNLLPAVPAVNDAYYFGAHRTFTVLNLTVGTLGAGNTVAWEYYNGAWTGLSGVTDNTNAFGTAGTNTVTFTLPGDWVATDDVGVLPVSCFWIRARVTVAGAVALGTQAWTNAIDVDDWVYITTTDDTAAPALATVAETMPAIGVVCEKMTTEVRVKTDAKWAQATKGWSAGNEAWISDTTVGDIVNVCPVMGVVEKVADVKADPGGAGNVLVLEIA